MLPANTLLSLACLIASGGPANASALAPQIGASEGSPLEYWLATTDPMDLRAMDRVRMEKPERSDLELLEEMASRFPNGASVT